jgi:hypothetical protein
MATPPDHGFVNAWASAMAALENDADAALPTAPT